MRPEDMIRKEIIRPDPMYQAARARGEKMARDVVADALRVPLAARGLFLLIVWQKVGEAFHEEDERCWADWQGRVDAAVAEAQAIVVRGTLACELCNVVATVVCYAGGVRTLCASCAEEVGVIASRLSDPETVANLLGLEPSELP